MTCYEITVLLNIRCINELNIIEKLRKITRKIEKTYYKPQIIKLTYKIKNQKDALITTIVIKLNKIIANKIKNLFHFNKDIIRYIIIKRKLSFVKKSLQERKIDYKNTKLLAVYTNEFFQIKSRKQTLVKKHLQKKITKEIKIARFMGLMPYTTNNKLNE